MPTALPIAPQPQPQQVAQVLPIQLTVGQAPGADGNPVVILQIGTAFGTFVFPIDGKTARLVGTQLQQQGSAAATGLILAR